MPSRYSMKKIVLRPVLIYTTRFQSAVPYAQFLASQMKVGAPVGSTVACLEGAAGSRAKFAKHIYDDETLAITVDLAQALSVGVSLSHNCS